MKQFLKIISVAVVLAMPVLAQAYSGVISIDSVDVQPGDHFSLPVRITNNDMPLAALTIPIRYHSPYLTLDSVSFAGTIAPSSLFGAVNNNKDSQTVRISLLPDPSTAIQPITASSGILARLWFSVSMSAVPTSVSIDSIYNCTTLGSGVRFCVRVEVSDTSGLNTVMPGFEPGVVVVRVPTAVGDDGDGLLPQQFNLAQNYPNPFNPTTVIAYTLPEASTVDLTVFNLLGQKVVTLVNGFKPAGTYQVDFDAKGLPSGIYFYRLVTKNNVATKKMMLLK